MALIEKITTTLGRVGPVCGAIAVALTTATLLGGAANGTPPAAIASPPNPERGLRLATKLCSNCHDVDGKSGAVQSAASASSFASAANRPGQTPERLEGYMLEPPHPAMPQVQLTGEEIRDITAYILTLKKP